MGDPKTFLVAIGLSLPLISGAARAMPTTAADPVMTFAVCTGRLSAQMEHQWIVDPPASDATRSQRARMLALLDAVLLPEQGPQALNWRIEAKQAQTQLLARALNSSERREADYAARLARRELAACNALLL
ncbi:hypothetical protein [Pseudooceanicola sp.]|uniref:hypothetical protein n=1 Tax=Pseudooceanicola sp. TaxID=1914328 RepID=UPI00260FF83B|nr:hypothetical protein [Pseudooceanicola sp.]MDF1854363.1 hypothetical protein [Pseudooceanicola sp.]